MAVKPIPDGFHTVTPMLLAQGSAKLLEFIQQAFGAEVTECMRGEDGAVLHAQARIGDSMVMVADPRAPFGAMPMSVYLYVKDTDATYQAALKAGGTSLMTPANQFYGDRNAGVSDPFGNLWWIATHVEDVSPDEIKRRAASHHK